jgi:hypothetical protein
MDRSDWVILIGIIMILFGIALSVVGMFIWGDQCLHVSSSLEKSLVAPCTKR